MNIYTYYGETNNPHGQQELLDIWLSNWRGKGWSPHILTKGMAKEAPLHDEYVDFVNRIHSRINKNNTFRDNTYAMEAQREIVAFTLIEQPSFISDYDVFNINYDTTPPEDKVHWRDALCTCFASGGSTGWTKYIQWIFTREQQILEGCVEEYNRSNRDCFHDQDFLIFALKGITSSPSFNKPVYMQGVPFYEYRDVNSPVPLEHLDGNSRTLHISHRSVSVHPGYSDLTSWEKRIQLAKDCL